MPVDCKKILQELTVQDFCKKEHGDKEEFAGNDVYFFAPERTLVDIYGVKYQNMQLYIKFTLDIPEKVFVISFHLPEHGHLKKQFHE